MHAPVPPDDVSASAWLLGGLPMSGSVPSDGGTLVAELSPGLPAQDAALVAELTGDGLDDLVLSAARTEPAGAWYWIVEQPWSEGQVLDATNAVLTSGTVPEPWALMGYTRDLAGVVTAIDANLDGTKDLVLGNRAVASEVGAVFVHHGPLSGARTVEDAEVTLEGEFPGAHFGADIANVGDLDADGDDELLVGAPRIRNSGEDAQDGSAYLFRAPIESGRTASEADSIFGGVVPHRGEAHGGGLGHTVYAVGDLSGDDVPDYGMLAPTARRLDDEVLEGFDCDTHRCPNAGVIYLFWGE